MGKVDVVVIDGDPGVCSVISAILCNAGISHAVANDGVTGISLVESNGPALAVIDSRLGRLDGVDVAKQIHQLGMGTKFLFMTGFTEGLPEHVADLPLAGRLEKPFDIINLVEIIGDNIIFSKKG